MKENKYDEPEFFSEYSKMSRSKLGLKGAGEWHILKKMLPDFEDKRVLDLGCGFGWHCMYAAELGAKYVLGIDISENMLKRAKELNAYQNVEYRKQAIEDYVFAANSFDIVISSLAFHYLSGFDTICKKVYNCLSENGFLIFSVEHPVFTADGSQCWIHDEYGRKIHWPVDRYFDETLRNPIFLNNPVKKYHRTLSNYINGLIKNGFEIIEIAEPQPEATAIDILPELKDELRRPMFLILSARKK